MLIRKQTFEITLEYDQNMMDALQRTPEDLLKEILNLEATIGSTFISVEVLKKDEPTG
jgi:hypothetical protein